MSYAYVPACHGYGMLTMKSRESGTGSKPIFPKQKDLVILASHLMNTHKHRAPGRGHSRDKSCARHHCPSPPLDKRV